MRGWEAELRFGHAAVRGNCVGFTFLNAEPEANEIYAVSMKDTDSLSQ